MPMPNSITFRFMKTAALTSVCLFVAIAVSGCRCGQQCGQPFGAQQCAPQQCAPQQFAPQQYVPQQPATQPFGAPGYAVPGYGYTRPNLTNSVASVSGNTATIAAPGTYSLNIPGGRGVNPFANTASAANANGTRVGQLPNGSNGLLNTRLPAPTPATGPNSPGIFNQREGWRSGNGSNLNTQSGSTTSANASQLATSVLDRSGSLGSNAASTVPTLSRINNVSLTTPPAQNVATTVSTDYRTTAVDERRDTTRLPVTDASNMQPISRVAQNTGSVPQQPYYQPNATAVVPNYQGRFAQPANTAYQGTFQNPVNSYSAPVSQPQLVQAQSTATYDPYSSTASDWRTRAGQTQY